MIWHPTTPTDPTISPTQLPYDLERMIIEYAAETDQPMALKLMVVSREVKQWYVS